MSAAEQSEERWHPRGPLAAVAHHLWEDSGGIWASAGAGHGRLIKVWAAAAPPSRGPGRGGGAAPEQPPKGGRQLVEAERL
jgi:hypothetical protein